MQKDKKILQDSKNKKCFFSIKKSINKDLNEYLKEIRSKSVDGMSKDELRQELIERRIKIKDLLSGRIGWAEIADKYYHIVYLVKKKRNLELQEIIDFINNN